jgi:hypothetical protein
MLLNFSFLQVALLATCAASALVIATVVKYILASRRPKGFPNGPATLPLIGNLHQLPTTKAFLKYEHLYNLRIDMLTFSRFQEWRKEYGDIIGLKFGPTNVVVLNNYKHVKE